MSLERTPEQERLTAIVRRFPQRKVVVVGDLVADQFLYGEISRVSREAPVLILRHEKTETTPGGAANCAVNLASLDARAVLIGVTGEDKAGDALLGHLIDHVTDCGQRRNGDAAVNVIEADHGDVPRHAQPRVGDAAQSAERKNVVIANDRSDVKFAA